MSEGDMADIFGRRAEWCIAHADCRYILGALEDNCIDAVVTDPPYELNFMARNWDRSGIAYDDHLWSEVLRVLKPGGHLVAFGGTRTAHRIACAIEDGGFEIRDSLAWMHGQGFPKSVNLGNGRGSALKPAFEPIILARKPLGGTLATNLEQWRTGALNIDACRVAHAGAADRAAHDAQVAAIKARGGSMDGSWKNSSDLSGANDVNEAGRWPPNVLLSHQPSCERLGTRSVKANPTWDTTNRETEPSAFTGETVSTVRHAVNGAEEVPIWRCIDGCPVRQLDAQSGTNHAGVGVGVGGIWSKSCGLPAGEQHGDSGTASRYFPQFQPSDLDDITPFLYQAKPSRGERDLGLERFRARSGAEATNSEEGQARLNSPRTGAGRNGGARNIHPTVKSIDLMRWLVRLITPPGGIVLDCFCGSGSTGVAARLEGVRFLGIEMNDTDKEPFVSIARARLAHVDGRTFEPREELRSPTPPRQGALF